MQLSRAKVLSEGREQMSEDLTDKLPKKNGEILTAIKNLGERVGKMDFRLQGLEQKVDGLEKKVAEKFYDTRPIWHQVVDKIGELQVGQTKLEVGQTRLEDNQLAMREQIRDLDSALRSVNRDQIVLNDVVRRIHLDFHTLDERLHRLIDRPNPQNSST